MTEAVSEPGGRRVRVEFWGLLPDGQDLSALDPLDVAVLLAQPFALAHIDCITAVPEPAPLPVALETWPES